VATILLFAKQPVPGRVKTRLTPFLTPNEASELAAAFLRDSAAALADVPDSVLEIALPSEDSREAVERLLGPHHSTVDQGPGDLGERLAHATECAFARRDGPVAVVGSDHPNLPARRVARALEEARRGRIGWVPTEDGGYAALALPRPIPGLFHDVPWSTAGVAEATRRNARTLGFALTDLGTWYDVDTPEDLRRLHREILAANECPATRTVLATLKPPLEERAPLSETRS
jgi:rSAM/selenodomain-associated transferase 1